MLLKRLLPSFNTLKAIVTQRETPQSFPEFKASLRAYQENTKPQKEDSIMKTLYKKDPPACFRCNKNGHFARNCTKSRWCKFCEVSTHDTKF